MHQQVKSYLPGNQQQQTNLQKEGIIKMAKINQNKISKFSLYNLLRFFFTKKGMRLLIDLILVITLFASLHYQPDNNIPICQEKRLEFKGVTYKQSKFHYGDQIDYSKIKLSNQYSDYNQTQVVTKLSTIEMMQAAFFLNILGKNISQNQNLKKISEFQREYYDRKYNITKYQEEIQICFIITSFQNQADNRYKASLDSIFQQDYQNYFVIYVNDFSSDQTGMLVEKYMNNNPLAKQKMTLINNKYRKGKSRNQYETAHQYCKPGSIMIDFDGDDHLVGRQVFKLLNAVYQQKKARYLSMNFMRFLKSNQNPTLIYGYSIAISDQVKKARDYRKLETQMHLRSWMSDIFLNISESEYKINGQFVSIGQDQLSTILLMEKAGDKVQYVPQIVYVYNQDTGLNDSSNILKILKRIIINIYAKHIQKKASQYMEEIQFRLKKPSK